jgi:hypothetical protein
MKRRPSILLFLTFLLAFVLTCYSAAQDLSSPDQDVESDASRANDPKSDQPPDLTPYDHTAGPDEYAPEAESPLPKGVAVIDIVVTNTDAALKKDKNFIRNNGEPSIAVGTLSCGVRGAVGCVAITAFSATEDETWDKGNAPIWLSTNNGGMWSLLPKAIPPPSGVANAFLKGCPCDQTIEFERFYLAGSFLTGAAGGTNNVYSGSSSNLTDSKLWQWEETVRGTADTTNRVLGRTDQPWLLQGTQPLGSNVRTPFFLYSAYQLRQQQRVAVADRGDPPVFRKFNLDSLSGTSAGVINSGLRMATGHPPNNVSLKLNFNDVYSVYQLDEGLNAGMTAYKIQYFLNRTGDKGKTWGLEGDLTVEGGKCTVAATGDKKGCLIAKADSTQGCSGGGACVAPNTFKFGGVNALLGGVDSIAVDPVSDIVYVVYGKRTADGNNRLFLAHFKLMDTLSRLVRVGDDIDVTGAANTALPAVAVTPDRTVAVFYYSLEGMNGDGYPIFTAHLQRSYDKGVRFTDLVLLDKFASPAKDDPSVKQRVYGDYVQLKTMDNNFYGTFTANRTKFCNAGQGCTESTDDPIFYYVPSTAR